MSRRRMMYNAGDMNTVLLLHFDGNYDDSSRHKIVVRNNPSASKFGTGRFGKGVDIDGNYPIYDINIGAGNITVEFFIKISSNRNSDWMGLFGSFEHQASTGKGVAFRYTGYNNSGVQVYVKNGATEYASGWLGTLTLNLWYYIAIVVSGGYCKVYKDGVLWTSFPAEFAGMDTLYFGRWALQDVERGFPALIDEFRISNIARYTANFTPPTQPFK